ncbi:hypothetical protein BJX61DRAFT_313426 [Aspergillus egyptiacus]|nr:hypothetical protein BJX61DRAFT_313426 [Aspergillus egyptiacus]
MGLHKEKKATNHTTYNREPTWFSSRSKPNATRPKNTAPNTNTTIDIISIDTDTEPDTDTETAAAPAAAPADSNSQSNKDNHYDPLLKYMVAHPFFRAKRYPVFRSARVHFLRDVHEEAAELGYAQVEADRVLLDMKRYYLEAAGRGDVFAEEGVEFGVEVDDFPVYEGAGVRVQFGDWNGNENGSSGGTVDSEEDEGGGRTVDLEKEGERLLEVTDIVSSDAWEWESLEDLDSQAGVLEESELTSVEESVSKRGKEDKSMPGEGSGLAGTTKESDTAASLEESETAAEDFEFTTAEEPQSAPVKTFTRKRKETKSMTGEESGSIRPEQESGPTALLEESESIPVKESGRKRKQKTESAGHSGPRKDMGSKPKLKRSDGNKDSSSKDNSVSKESGSEERTSNQAVQKPLGNLHGTHDKRATLQKRAKGYKRKRSGRPKPNNGESHFSPAPSKSKRLKKAATGTKFPTVADFHLPMIRRN